jgi:hypothetical protein
MLLCQHLVKSWSTAGRRKHVPLRMGHSLGTNDPWGLKGPFLVVAESFFGGKLLGHEQVSVQGAGCSPRALAPLSP